VEQGGTVFANEPERRHFAEYLTGLLGAEQKTVSGINAEFAQTTAQSCLNRWSTEVDWEATQLHEQRLAWVPQDPPTRSAPSGGMPIDNRRGDHAGKLSADVGYCWDHAEQRPKSAHDSLRANDVCPSGKPYAVAFRRLRQRADGEAQPAHRAAPPGGVAAAPAEEQRLATFKRHTLWCCEVVAWVVERQIPGPCAFDSYFTNAPLCNPLAGRQRADGGELQFNRKVWFGGTARRADALAAQLPGGARKKVPGGERTQGDFTKKIWRPQYTPAVRRVLLWAQGNSKEPVKLLITNPTPGEVTRVLGGYGQRWTGTETLQRDGQPHWGWGDCQLRSGAGQTHPLYLVLLVHSLRMVQLRQGRARAWPPSR
jgi:hypothetical protein